MKGFRSPSMTPWILPVSMPVTEERSTYLYRAYTKWCEDNLESPVPQKKFSQFLLKNAGKYGLTFAKHIEGKYRGFRGVCVHPAFAAA